MTCLSWNKIYTAHLQLWAEWPKCLECILWKGNEYKCQIWHQDLEEQADNNRESILKHSLLQITGGSHCSTYLLIIASENGNPYLTVWRLVCCHAPDLNKTFESFDKEIVKWLFKWCISDEHPSRLQNTVQQTNKKLYSPFSV